MEQKCQTAEDSGISVSLPSLSGHKGKKSSFLPELEDRHLPGTCERLGPKCGEKT